MANNVDYSWQIQKLTKEGVEFLITAFKDKEDLHEIEVLQEGLGESGPKWAHIDDQWHDDDSYHVNGQSAWSAPSNAVVDLHEVLLTMSPQCFIEEYYQDEMPHFCGAFLHEPWADEESGILENTYDGCEWEDQEIYEHMKLSDLMSLIEEIRLEDGIEENADLGEMMESDRFQEVWYDHVWDTVNELQQDQMSNQLSYMGN